jgi:ubiquinone/menaquinone biosynthesis C-methylase UbiE
MLTSGERRITGVDHDRNKIIVARHGYLKNDNISFTEADVSEYPITPRDGFLFGDILHYLTYDKQKSLLQTCIRNLKPGGIILIREGNADKGARQKLREIAGEHGLIFEMIDQKRILSDNFFVMRMPVKDNSINIMT